MLPKIIFNKAAALGTGPCSTFRNQIMNVANIFIQFAELPTKLMFDCLAASNKKICASRNIIEIKENTAAFSNKDRKSVV